MNNIHKDKHIGMGWIAYITLWRDGDVRIGFRLSSGILNLDIFFFSIGVWNNSAVKGYRLK